MIKPGTIIFLNGTSSSGKSTLLRALQVQLSEAYLEAGIDKFIFMLPPRYLNTPLWDEVLGRASESGEMGHRLFSGMHYSIAALARAGNNVLADHVLVEPAWVRECAEVFAELPAYLIGVRCPLDVMNAREAARGDRTLGQAAKQFHKVHAHGVYDLEVDTSTLSVDECVQQIASHIESHAPSAFKQLLKEWEELTP